MNPRIPVTAIPTATRIGIIIMRISKRIPARAEVRAASPLAIPHVERIKPFVNAAKVAPTGPTPSTCGIDEAAQSTVGNTSGITRITSIGKRSVKTPAFAPLPPR
jgi:hypothetical protein